MKLASLCATIGLAAFALSSRCHMEPATARPPFQIAGKLERDAAGCLYRDPQGGLHRLGVMGLVPYTLVSLGPPVLVTTIGEDLSAATYAGGEAISRFEGFLPICVDPPVVALDIVEPEAEGILLLLNPDGTEGLRLPGAQLLPPASGETAGLALVAYPGIAPDLVWPLGEQPVIACVDCCQMQELWRVRLPAGLPVAGIDLVAQSNGGIVVALQHDYLRYSWLVVSPAGKQLSYTGFDGQPSVDLLWPGPAHGFAELRCTSDWAELGVDTVDGRRTVLRFSLGDGMVTDTGRTFEVRPQRDERELATVGGNTVVRQYLLPSAAGELWSIPALVNSQAEVLVVDKAGAHWVAWE